ncbi:hypothetical protein HNO52_03240 [Billgrantia diversa]|uniref:hypothetical protein n=1 Tax=Halomonas sp. MCCC 1A13316 TaxID=2733487 RepID=UPI0018A427C5|nr:hypothetical protein [Halomonas sp. MCCC 1A13316]QOR37642.1 hypothetical protein HNO52_03240 [Halomonas sp. MCCC 1A13316]
MARRAQVEPEARAKPTPGSRESLWPLAMGPLLWTVHFVLSYATAAVWCAKVGGESGSLGGVRLAIGIYTVLTLSGIAIVIWRGLRKHRFGTATVPHDFDTPADRHRFLGFATVLLGGLSFVATLYVALPAVFIESCR